MTMPGFWEISLQSPLPNCSLVIFKWWQKICSEPLCFPLHPFVPLSGRILYAAPVSVTTVLLQFRNILRNSASSFHGLSSSIFNVRSPRIGNTSSHLHYMMFQTIQNNIFSVRIWSWQRVSVNISWIHYWVEPSLLLSSSVQDPPQVFMGWI